MEADIFEAGTMLERERLRQIFKRFILKTIEIVVFPSKEYQCETKRRREERRPRGAKVLPPQFEYIALKVSPVYI